MMTQMNLLLHKILNYVILEYFLKYYSIKEVVSAIYIITNLSTQEIIRQNQCQISFLDKLVLKKDADKN